MCSTLAVTSKVRSGKAPWTASMTRARVVRAVQEIGVAEGDVARSHGHELGDVGHHGVLAHQAGAAVVDDGHGTVPAPVRAAVAGLDVAGQAAFAPEGKAGVAVEAREEVAGREPEPAPPELDHGVGPAPARRPGRRVPATSASTQATRRGSYSPAMARSATGATPSAPSRPAYRP